MKNLSTTIKLKEPKPCIKNLTKSISTKTVYFQKNSEPFLK